MTTEELAEALCAHYASTRIITRGQIITHLEPDETQPCQSCTAAARAITNGEHT